MAYYLPQFHETEDNNKWWGKGFTEWVNVKKAKPLFENHNQPRVPLNNNYYDLSKIESIKWQTELAKKYGIYGFCIYHYWFNGHLLLEKPLEMIRDSSEINFPYSICWANENWTNAWVAEEGNVKTLIKQDYGDKSDWEKHFQYLLGFFRDPNYIKESNRPQLVIYRPELISNLNDMLDYWSDRAIDYGFDGIDFAYQQLSFAIDPKHDESRFKYSIEYQPGYARYDENHDKKSSDEILFNKFKEKVRRSILQIDKKMHTNFLSYFAPQHLKFENYEEICKYIVKRKAINKKSIGGMYVGWDNTPRKGTKGQVSLGSTPELFEKYLKLQIDNIKTNYSNDYLYIFAWNEWAEGGYLEPDTKYGYAYLEAIYNALNEDGDQKC
ncbi:glycoside hydrolase family 99-like domain-containing protein [Paucilactobacillus nenjiangensis]|uniref:glycosyltransferase WbsX family protein n=1 Tax=Paucilactobacillus nenjiangensis TaxID=1296540 RepID=UPI0028D44350|nr:glycoside hydrolase family 99-like domain-containing protein [Paucilactobacillus nenjiangensis]